MHSILREQGKVHVDCEFCGRGYEFDEVDVQTLFVPEAQSAHSGARH